MVDARSHLVVRYLYGPPPFQSPPPGCPQCKCQVLYFFLVTFSSGLCPVRGMCGSRDHIAQHSLASRTLETLDQSSSVWLDISTLSKKSTNTTMLRGKGRNWSWRALATLMQRKQRIAATLSATKRTRRHPYSITDHRRVYGVIRCSSNAVCSHLESRIRSSVSRRAAGRAALAPLTLTRAVRVLVLRSLMRQYRGSVSARTIHSLVSAALPPPI